MKVEKVKRAHSDANHNKASIREEVNIAAFASSDQEKESKQQRNSFEKTLLLEEKGNCIKEL